MADRTQQENDRTVLSVPQAAERLGITPDAVRARLHRGTLAGEKRSGTWRVFLPPTLPPGAPTGTQQDATGSRQAADRHEHVTLIARLESEVAYLRQTLDAEVETHTEEIRRRDHIIAGLVERVRELPATTAQYAPQDANPAPQRDDVVETTDVTLSRTQDAKTTAWQRWWRRITGG